MKPSFSSFAGLAFVAALTAACIAKPLYNWDMLPYLAAALAWREDDPVRIHREVYDAVRAVAPPRKLETLIGPVPHPYREDVYRSPEHFAQQVPFYSVKPAYPVMVLAVHALGFNLATASVLVAAVAYGAACLLLFAWLARRLPGAAALAGTVLLALAPPFLMLGRLSTPDSLYLLAFLGASFLLLERRAPHAAMILLGTAILTRPNGIVWYGMVGFYLTFLAPPDLRISRAACAGYAAISAVLFQTLQLASGNYPWATHFHHSWVAHLPSPATFVPTLGLADYARMYLAFVPRLASGDLPYFVLIGIVAGLARRRLGVPFRDDVASHLVLLAAPFFLLHWALYPGQLDRMYAPQYWLIGVVALAFVAGSQREATPSARTR